MQREILIVLCIICTGFQTSEALRFTQNPPARITKKAGEKVELLWKFIIDKPSELVRLECGYLNSSRKMTKLIEQLSTESQPRATTQGTKFFNRAYVRNSALVLTGLKVEDTGIYFCILKAYDARTFQTVTVRSADSYLSVGGPTSGGRGGSLSSSSRTTIIAIVVVAVVLLIAILGFFFFKKRDRSKRERIPTSYEDTDAKNGNFKATNHTSSLKETNANNSKNNRGLTSADIEVVRSPMDAVRQNANGMSYSTNQAYDRLETSNEARTSDAWPEPPTPQKTELPPIPLDKTSPPRRVPPRVLPKPRSEHVQRSSAAREDMFV